MKSDIPTPRIYRYNSYRDFLEDWIPYLKSTGTGFSLAKIEKESGVKANFLSMIISGAERMTDRARKALVPHLHLPESEASFFEALCEIEDARKPEQRLRGLRKAQRFLKYKKNNKEEVEVYHYLTQWYYSAIREMAGLRDFKADPKWIRTRLRAHVPPSEISKALEFLTQNGYIKVNEDGTYQIGKEPIRCDGRIFKIALASFYDQMFELQTQAIHKTKPDELYYTAYMSAVDDQNFEEIKGIIDDARKKIIEVTKRPASESSKTVQYIHLGMIPLTHKPKKE